MPVKENWHLLDTLESDWRPLDLNEVQLWLYSTTEPGPVPSYCVSTIPATPAGRTPQILDPAVPVSRLGE
jgi:hypothetical protein